MPTMFSHFTPRHIAPLLLATQLCIGGLYPFLYTPSAALLKFGFTPQIAASKAAWPVIKTGSARVTAMGIALWGMYLGGHFEAMDIMIASLGWVAVVDGIVCGQEGAEGSVVMRVGVTVVIALWGALGMTTGRWL
ncbi:hypothetical protein HBH61_030100 [Parastagonospora nodorum]|nr:hypothetical protein HBH61_030100 [Parastagonospora nodorum]